MKFLGNVRLDESCRYVILSLVQCFCCCASCFVYHYLQNQCARRVYLNILCFITETKSATVEKQTTLILPSHSWVASLVFGFYKLNTCSPLCPSLLFTRQINKQRWHDILLLWYQNKIRLCETVLSIPKKFIYLCNFCFIVALVCSMWAIHMVAVKVSSYTVYWDRSYLCLIMLVPMLGDLDWPTPVDNQMPLSI